MSYTISEIDRKPTFKTLAEKREKYSIKDFTSFTPSFYTKDLVVARNENSIKMALRALLRTRRGDTLMRPESGSRLDDYLFEPINNNTAENIKTSIRDVIKTEVSDILELLDVQVIPREDEYGYQILMTVQYLKRPSEVINVTDFIERP